MQNDEVIDVLYRGILGRPADPVGLKLCQDALEQGVALHEVLRSLLGSEEAEGYCRSRSRSLPPPEEIAFQGMQLLAPLGDPVQSSIRQHGTHEAWVEGLLPSLLHPDSIFVDVGANIGIFTLLAAGMLHGGGTVYAFEAFPRNVQYLAENVRRSGFTNIILVPLALSDVFGSTTMYCGSDTSNAAVRKRVESAAWRLGEHAVVPSAPLDMLFRDVKRIDLIKVDIEGHEPKMLKGSLEVMKRLHPKVISEFSPEYIKAADCGAAEEYLQVFFSLGYSVSILHREGQVEDVKKDGGLVLHRWGEANEAGVTHLDLLFE